MSGDHGGARPVRVVFDTRMAVRRRTGGARHITGLRRALDEDPRVELLAVSGPPGLPRKNTFTSLGNLVIDLFWTHVGLPATALVRRADLIHAPFNWAPLAATVRRRTDPGG